MFESICAKIRNIGLSNFHTLLDNIQGLNSVGSYEQYLRDLNKGRNDLDDHRAGEQATLSMLNDRIITLQTKIDEANENIDALLGDDDPANDKFAVALQVGVDQDEQSIKRIKAELAEVQGRIDQYTDAISRLDIRLAEARGKLEELRSLDQRASASAGVAKTLSRIDIGSAPDTSGAEKRLRRQAAVSTNQLSRELSRVTGSAGGPGPSAAEAAAQAKLALRKRQLAAKAAGSSTGDPTG